MPTVEPAAAFFTRSAEYWRGRFIQRGPLYLTLNPNECRLQLIKVESLLRTRFKPGEYYADGIDLGCGNGRFAPLLSSFVGHIWGLDFIAEPLEAMRKTDVTVSARKLDYPVKLPHLDKSIDIFTAIFTLQHITNDLLLEETLAEVARVLKPGARVITLDNASDHHAYLKPRNPNKLAEMLGLRKGFHFQRVTINNKPNDHWLIDGIKA